MISKYNGGMKTDHVIALIARVRDKAYEFIIRELNKKKITGLVPSHGGIMSTLFKKDKVPMKELAERIGRDKSTVTALVNKLMRAGYVAKEKDPDDNRITYLCLTAKGRSLEGDFDEISEKLIATTFRGFSQKEREDIVKGIVKMLNNF
ncbi:MAG: winged helix-turn-helix transcriptional regulator [candidate division WOR-3 bacterium]|nr:MAG: winged helix-turn-helix transcriptional regulator [candidate division WOR-3 bacterium]